jgi:hypothetical protein
MFIHQAEPLLSSDWLGKTNENTNLGEDNRYRERFESVTPEYMSEVLMN